MKVTYEQVLQAVARGWCSEDNSGKEMDATLASAIADEVWHAIGGFRVADTTTNVSAGDEQS